MVLPAHAGMIPVLCLIAAMIGRAPRTCGDDPARKRQ